MSVSGVALHFYKTEIYFPLRAELRKGNYLYSGQTYHMVEIRLYYVANGAIGFLHKFFPKSKWLGYHEGDIESLFLLIDKEGEVEWVYLKAHSRGQGVWLPAHDCEIDENEVLHVCVARASHAFYPLANNTYLRIFGLANDECAIGGPKEFIMFDDIPEGSKPAKENIAHTSVTPLQRFLLPLTYRYLKTRP